MGLDSNVMFQHLDSDQRTICIDAFEEHCVPSGKNIICQGDDGDFFYVLEAGTADCYVASVNGPPKKVLEYTSGMSFGELALLHGDARAATVTATSDCRCW